MKCTNFPNRIYWHAANVDELRLPELYDINDVVATFRAAGFDASAARLALKFVPAASHGHHEGYQLFDWLNYYYDQKLLLRFGR
jgi:hypothetical protein